MLTEVDAYMRGSHISSEARAILRTARVIELKKLAAKTTATFDDAKRCTTLSAIEIERQMALHLDSYRDDYARRCTSVPAAESVHRCRKPRAILVLPSQPYARQTVMRCLIRRG
jgi:hypothetical protein